MANVTTTLLILAATLAIAVAVAVWDRRQTRHTILANFPLIGHLRYVLEHLGPELRQYIVAHNREEKPFTRAERSWVYASAKKQDNHFGFGTEVDLDQTPGHLIITPATFPVPAPAPDDHALPAARVLGGAHHRREAFTPESIVWISAMSYGALSGRATAAFNGGARIAGALHNTGEGGISEHHRHGGDLVFQIGTGYFGCRDGRGRFNLDKLAEACQSAPVRAIEIKLSQGAKAGLGGILPAAKVTPAIAAARGVPEGLDCISPSTHSAFTNTGEMIEFIETIAEATGLPVGIKSAIGELTFWRDLAARMAAEHIGPDFITVDGGEGGTGAAPLAFADHVALPYKTAAARVHHLFAEAGATDQTLFVGSGKLGFPETAMAAFALGADMLAVGREVMLAGGCIQAQRCHTGGCPAGIATQTPWLEKGFDVPDKTQRVANYLTTLRHEIKQLTHAAGYTHPTQITPDRIEILNGHLTTTSLADLLHTSPHTSLHIGPHVDPCDDPRTVTRAPDGTLNGSPLSPRP